ncbi:MAG: hypothetical protein UZ19_OD1000529 [Parcubacteria bacterium OLB19]|nr:MAG: hypothetical protein UZ19_OD1000529 [Parcubacteria bacterium OLB19]
MEQSIKEQLDAQAQKIDAIYESVEKTRKYFQIILWATVIMFVLPMVGLMFIVPSFIETYTTSISGLQL